MIREIDLLCLYGVTFDPCSKVERIDNLRNIKNKLSDPPKGIITEKNKYLRAKNKKGGKYE